ncbi:tyrosine-type recombinase/integrase [Turneriella parva]|uniref:Integrase family protein n=1 Tax=Turneriella parva (strain ATCC BAA-1111 / DSM 21527 / NCTC 11395 / H) TaxID=869212 RepID=I4B7P6_TURPD|nr:site-specific integrase [Turneriella parva]AFM13303.1 integrase family protein [Turneriella parva DSM 21527]
MPVLELDSFEIRPYSIAMSAIQVPNHAERTNELIAVLNLPRNYRWQIQDFLRYCEIRNLPVDAFSFRKAVDDLREKVRNHQVSAAKFNLFVAANRRLIIKSMEMQNASAIDIFAVTNLLREPAIKIPRSKTETDVLTIEEIEVLKRFATARGSLIIELLQITALRISEALTLSARLTKQGLCYRGSVLGKGHKMRDVYLPEDLYHRISSVFKGESLLFETRRGNRLDRHGVLKMLKVAAHKAVAAGAAGAELLEKARLHIFRHTFATNALSKGIDLYTLAQYMGHSQVQTLVDFYVKKRPNAETVLKVYEHVA